MLKKLNSMMSVNSKIESSSLLSKKDNFKKEPLYEMDPSTANIKKLNESKSMDSQAPIIQKIKTIVFRNEMPSDDSQSPSKKNEPESYMESDQIHSSVA